MARKTFKLGLCTGGGDCPGLNAAIRAVTRHAIGSHGWEVLGIAHGLTGLMAEPQRILPLTLAKVEDIVERGGTILGTTNQGSPFRDKERGPAVKASIIKAWKRHKLDAMVVIGGDGTQFMTRELSVSGLPIVGIPKTIDNDLCGTDLTIGYSTAVDVAAAAALRLASSADAHDRVMLLEVMGRDAGHIALNAAIAAGADFALLPEIPFDVEALARRLAARRKRGKSAALIVVAEGAAPLGGDRSFQLAANGAKLLGGIGTKLAHLIHEQTGIDARATVLGHLQRGGAPNAEDRILAARFGVRAVELVAAGEMGHVVGTAKGRLTTIPYAKVQDRRRVVDLGSDAVRTAEGMGISLGRPSDYDELF